MSEYNIYRERHISFCLLTRPRDPRTLHFVQRGAFPIRAASFSRTTIANELHVIPRILIEDRIRRASKMTYEAGTSPTVSCKMQIGIRHRAGCRPGRASTLRPHQPCNICITGGWERKGEVYHERARVLRNCRVVGCIAAAVSWLPVIATP